MRLLTIYGGRWDGLQLTDQWPETTKIVYFESRVLDDIAVQCWNDVKFAAPDSENRLVKCRREVNGVIMECWKKKTGGRRPETGDWNRKAGRRARGTDGQRGKGAIVNI